MRLILFLFLATIMLVSCNKKKNSKPKELVYHKNDKDWYTRAKGATKYLIHISKGKPEIAIEYANKQGLDAEACFVKAVAYAKMENADSTIHYVYQSLHLGLTIDAIQVKTPNQQHIVSKIILITEEQKALAKMFKF